MNAAKKWVVVVEQTVEGLLGLAPPEKHINSWKRAWDKISDLDLEGEEDGDQVDSGAETRRRRPDAWPVNRDQRRLIIWEFTRPND